MQVYTQGLTDTTLAFVVGGGSYVPVARPSDPLLSDGHARGDTKVKAPGHRNCCCPEPCHVVSWISLAANCNNTKGSRFVYL